MRGFFTVACAAALMVPLMATTAGAQTSAPTHEGAGVNSPRAGVILAADTGGPRGFRGTPPGGGGGFRGPPRGGFRGGGFRGDRFRGSIFIGPSFGYYDPFWWPYGYPYGYAYGYYPPPVVVHDYQPPPPDYLIPPDSPPPEQSWFHCSNPEGYYPYVRSCDGPWQAVPVTPDNQPPPPPPER
ncbi:MAG TPA: hypothetical protein VNH44_09595 [Micropepsaceae bacterium]|nr:hypothetical protein [Micropepsaceae bacterium]